MEPWAYNLYAVDVIVGDAMRCDAIQFSWTNGMEWNRMKQKFGTVWYLRRPVRSSPVRSSLIQYRVLRCVASRRVALRRNFMLRLSPPRPTITGVHETMDSISAARMDGTGPDRTGHIVVAAAKAKAAAVLLTILYCTYLLCNVGGR